MTSKQPSHVVYHVRELEGRDKDLWVKIGAAWQQAKGYRLELEYLPLAPGRIVMLEPKDKPDDES